MNSSDSHRGYGARGYRASEPEPCENCGSPTKYRTAGHMPLCDVRIRPQSVQCKMPLSRQKDILNLAKQAQRARPRRMQQRWKP